MELLKILCIHKGLIANILTGLGLVLNLIGAWFLSKGLLLKNNDIEAIAGTFYGGNPLLEKNLKENRDNAKKGFCFLGLGFVLQLTGLFLNN